MAAGPGVVIRLIDSTIHREIEVVDAAWYGRTVVMNSCIVSPRSPFSRTSECGQGTISCPP